MDNKKFEQLIDLVINENEEQARALFHDIVVEKSREIYENMMHDEMDEGMDGMGGQVGQMMDEISAEEEGMTEEEDETVDFDDEDDEDIVDIDTDDDMGDDEGVEERLVSIEDKLDQLMAEFEEIMGNEDGEMDHMEPDADNMGGPSDHDDDNMDDEMNMADEAMMEAITLKKVSVTHGDNGQNTKSTSLQNSGQAGMDSRPVKFSGASETVPTSPKGPSNFYSKGESSVKGAGSFKNSPAQNNADLEKAPAPKKGDDGSNAKSPVAESRKPVKRRI
jgi:predicted phage tail protein